ncbi:MAG: hypothetical protein FJ312_10615 [SAR202 cluster bacterium]|nr:hypothetical protein [SAR202 cluster bacterium]
MAVSARPDVLRTFVLAVLDEWTEKVQNADDELLAAVHRAELERLGRVLRLLVPDAFDEDGCLS